MARSWGPDNTENEFGSDATLARFAADSRIDDAIQRRSRERWLRQQAREATSLRDTCLSLAEAATSVTLFMDNGRQHRGPLRAVGTDFVVCHSAGRPTWLALAALVAVTGSAELAGERAGSTNDALFSDVLGELCNSGASVALVLASGLVMQGEVQWVSEEILALRVVGGQSPTSTSYLRLSSVTECSVIASG